LPRGADATDVLNVRGGSVAAECTRGRDCSSCIRCWPSGRELPATMQESRSIAPGGSFMSPNDDEDAGSQRDTKTTSWLVGFQGSDGTTRRGLHSLLRHQGFELFWEDGTGPFREFRIVILRRNRYVPQPRRARIGSPAPPKITECDGSKPFGRVESILLYARSAWGCSRPPTWPSTSEP
jgi:hypothetical protein